MEKETESSRLVIDSSVFVDHLRNYPPALELFRSFSEGNKERILFSAVTETELIAGKSCNDNHARSVVLNMLNSFTKIEVNNPIALKAGDLCRLYAVDLPDSIIAATALINKAELLTRNIKDFNNIDGLKVRAPY